MGGHWESSLRANQTYFTHVVSRQNSVTHTHTVLQGNCNAGVSTSNEKGYYGLWNFWLTKQGIANLLSILQLEKDGYLIDYNTKRFLAVTTPEMRGLVLQENCNAGVSTSNEKGFYGLRNF